MKIMFVCLIGGFLGSGKTTLLIEMAKAASDAGKKVAVIVNEAGEVGIDGTRISSEGLETVELAEGCICCSLSGSLQNTLIKVNKEFKPDMIALEPTGLALPHRVEQIIRTSMIDPERVISVGVVDAFRFESLLRKREDFMGRQLLTAEFIVVNKIDLVDEDTKQRTLQELDRICPGKKTILTSARTGEGIEEVIGRLI